MDLLLFLASIVPQRIEGVPAAGTVIGSLLFIAIEAIDKVRKLPTVVKLWASIIGALVIPSAAYGLQILLGANTLTANGLFLVGAVACWVWGTSQVIHGALQAK